MKETNKRYADLVVHELRTPLTTVRESMAQVRDRLVGEITKEQATMLDTLLEEVDRLGRILEEFTHLSNGQQAQWQLKRDRINVCEVTAEVISKFQSQACRKGIEFKSSFPREAVDVFASRDKLAQVLTNLVGNAIKFTEKGFIQVTVDDCDEMVECAISDTGHGISERDLGLAFEPFRQFVSRNGKGEAGSGLGLSICKTIVESHGGRIWMESELNLGTTVRFTLPRYHPREALKEYITSGLNEAMAQETVLSFLVFDITNIDEIGEKIGKDKTSLVSRQLMYLIRNNFRSERDQATVLDRRKILALLPATGKEDAHKIAAHIQAIFRAHGLRDRSEDRGAASQTPMLKFDCRVTTFPEDGKTKEALLEKLGK